MEIGMAGSFFKNGFVEALPLYLVLSFKEGGVPGLAFGVFWPGVSATAERTL
jgi:hypothetical protein